MRIALQGVHLGVDSKEKCHLSLGGSLEMMRQWSRQERVPTRTPSKATCDLTPTGECRATCQSGHAAPGSGHNSWALRGVSEERLPMGSLSELHPRPAGATEGRSRMGGVCSAQGGGTESGNLGTQSELQP